MEKGGIKVSGQMRTSDASVYAGGDVAAFPVKLLGGEVRRLEHVDCARRTARHAVAAALDPSGATGDIDYLPFFYSRVFALSWKFYGDNTGKAVHFGDLLLRFVFVQAQVRRALGQRGPHRRRVPGRWES